MTDQWFYLQQWAKKRAELEALKKGEVDDNDCIRDIDDDDEEEDDDGDIGALCGEEGTTDSAPQPPVDVH